MANKNNLEKEIKEVVDKTLPVNQKQMPEAVGSVSYSLTSPNGFPLIFTLRQPSFEKLLEQILIAEQTFIKDGYQPDIKRGGRSAVKSHSVVPNRRCPQCGSELIYFTAKGKQHIKCSTQKFYSGQVHGCPYVEWADRQGSVQTVSQPVNLPATPTSIPPQIPVNTPTFEPATQAQIALIRNRLPNLYREGLSKQEATQIISGNLGK